MHTRPLLLGLLITLLLTVTVIPTTLAQTFSEGQFEVVPFNAANTTTVSWNGFSYTPGTPPEGLTWGACMVGVEKAGEIVFSPRDAGCGCDATCAVYAAPELTRVGSSYDATRAQITFTADRAGLYAVMVPTTAPNPTLPQSGLTTMPLQFGVVLLASIAILVLGVWRGVTR